MTLHFQSRYIFSILFFLSSAFFAEAAKIPLSDTPAWVQKIMVAQTTAVKPKEVTSGYHTVLRDIQLNLDLQTEFQHSAYKVFTEDGVQEVSEIRVDYDPNYEKLLFHTVTIWRSGKAISKPASAKFKVIQREKELDRHIYNEKLTAIIILDDVRVNDIIEYSYTLKGWNPIFKDKYTAAFYLQFYDPVDEYFLKLTTSPKHVLTFKTDNTKVKPVISKAATNQAYTWHLKKIGGLRLDSDVPHWFDPYPTLYISELKNWAELVNWALPLYDQTANISKELQQEIDSIKTEFSGPETRLAATVRFVQDKIRYLGIENGISGYKPFPPAKIYKQRFGDCKDKSLLLVTMLRQMNIAASPALVNTNYGDQVKNWLPSAYAFNHCIVLAELPGRQIWIDPTISMQRGSYDSIATPAYKAALVLKKGVQGFTKITVPENAKVKITENYTFNTLHGKVTLDVKTQYFGYEADVQRSKFAASTTEEIEKDYLNYYADQFPNIEVDRGLVFIDDEQANIFTTMEEYTIQDIWTGDEEATDSTIIVNFYPQILRERLAMPKTLIRKMPIGLNYPLNIEETINVYLPESWTIEETSKSIKDKAFLFNHTVRYSPKSTCLTLSYNYKNIRDFVPVDDAKTYIKNQKLVLKELGYQISNTVGTGNSGTSPAKESVPVNWVMVICGLFFMVAAVLAAIKVFAYDSPLLTPYPRVVSISGWLVLVLIGLFISPAMRLVALFSAEYFSISVWQNLTDSKSETYQPGLVALIIVEYFVNVCLLVFNVLLIILFLKKRTSLPRLITIYYAINLIFLVTDVMAASMFDIEYEASDFKNIFSAFMACAIWIPYFNISKRVKHTFVNQLNPQKTEEPEMSWEEPVASEY